MAQGPRRRWKFGPGGPEEQAPPPKTPAEEPSPTSGAVLREAEAHFTPAGPEEETCREGPVLPPEERDSNVQ